MWVFVVPFMSCPLRELHLLFRSTTLVEIQMHFYMFIALIYFATPPGEMPFIRMLILYCLSHKTMVICTITGQNTGTLCILYGVSHKNTDNISFYADTAHLQNLLHLFRYSITWSRVDMNSNWEIFFHFSFRLAPSMLSIFLFRLTRFSTQDNLRWL